MTASTTAARRARLAELEAAVGRLRARYDVLMNAFRFEAARALVPRIEAAEREAQALARDLPPLAEPPPAPFTVARRPRRR
jgi:hypothetical protein